MSIKPTFLVFVIFLLAIPNAGLADHSPYPPEVIEVKSAEKSGTIIIDSKRKTLYFVLGGGKAVRYGIAVGREGFGWTGTSHVSRKAEWPHWRPPLAMRKRLPNLPKFVPGGPKNPMGARALYLGKTLYRIHGTNAIETLGREVSSGCFRMHNDDVIDLYKRTRIGAKVIVF